MTVLKRRLNYKKGLYSPLYTSSTKDASTISFTWSTFFFITNDNSSYNFPDTSFKYLSSELVSFLLISYDMAEALLADATDIMPIPQAPPREMAGCKGCVRLRLLDNHDGTYSLLTYQEPAPRRKRGRCFDDG